MSTLAVVEQILRDTKIPMSVREIVEHAGDELPTKSKTPDTVVARDLSMDIKKKGEASIFIRTAPGRYTMRDLYTSELAAKQVAGKQTEGSSGQDAAAPPRGDEQAAAVLSSVLRHDRAAPLAAPRPAKPAKPEKQATT